MQLAVGRGALVYAAHGAHVGVLQPWGHRFTALFQHFAAQAFGGVCRQHQPYAAALNKGIFYAGAHGPKGQLPLMRARIGPQQKNTPLRPCGQLLRRPGKQHAATVQHDHAGAALGLIQIGGRPHHRHAVLTQILHHTPQLAARLRVNAHPRLVEQQQTRRAQQGTGNAQLLLHAAR